MSDDNESPRTRKLRGISDEGYGYGEQYTGPTTAYRCKACPCNFKRPAADRVVACPVCGMCSTVEVRK
jgi:DNA-directed RNA polymerase subunit RPC12/RpoP